MMDLSRIEYLGLERVLKRESGEIIADTGNALLIRDSISGAYMLACEDSESGLEMMDEHIGPDCNLLMVADYDLGLTAFEKYGFDNKIECYQVAFYGKKAENCSELTVRVADESDLQVLIDNYDMVSPEELAEIVGRKNILLGYHRDRLVGFIGEHLEGSMGILYVFPEYRQMGFGTALQSCFINKTIEQGFIPFGQVEKENTNSLKLQKKLGMTCSKDLIVWMWR